MCPAEPAEDFASLPDAPAICSVLARHRYSKRQHHRITSSHAPRMRTRVSAAVSGSEFLDLCAKTLPLRLRFGSLLHFRPNTSRKHRKLKAVVATYCRTTIIAKPD